LRHLAFSHFGTVTACDRQLDRLKDEHTMTSTTALA